MSGSVPPGPAPVPAGAGAGGVSSAARASSTEAASAAACVVLREGTAPDHPRAVASEKAGLGRGARRGRLLDAPREQRLACDDEALDLRRALVELHDLGVAHQLLDRVVLDEAVAPVDLYGVRRDLHRGVGREALGVRGLERVAPALVEQDRGVP